MNSDSNNISASRNGSLLSNKFLTKGLFLLLAVALLCLGAGRYETPVAYGDSFDIADGDVIELIAALNAANSDGASDTINLAPGGTYTLTVEDNSGANGANGLPVIGSEITIEGNGAIIARSSATSTPPFRIIEVSPGGSLRLNNITISSGNAAAFGGGVYNDGGRLKVQDSDFSNNSAAEAGGGIENFGGLVIVTSSTFSGNSAGNPGGGAIDNAAGILTVTDTSITGNTAEFGGGIANFDGALEVIDSTISGNTAEETGAGIDNFQGAVFIENSVISGNTAAPLGIGFGQGGGVSNFQGNLEITDSTITGNTAVIGGGVENVDGSTATIKGSTISENLAEDGAGIDNFDSELVIINSTVSGNAADFAGGGFLNESNAILELTSVTVVNNLSSQGSGILNATSTVETINSIIAANQGADNCEGGLAGIISLGHNIDSDDTCNLTASGDMPGISQFQLGLGPLQDNGGQSETHQLLAGSPAIDAGDGSSCPPADQRGTPRPQGVACDIGAFEALPLPSADISLSLSSSPSVGKVGNPLAYTVEVTNNGPDASRRVLIHSRLDDSSVDVLTATTASGSCTVTASNRVDCTLGQMAVGESVTIEIEVQAVASGNVPSSAWIGRADKPDPDLTNNEAVLKTKILP